MLITFAVCARSPHTRRWINDWLGVVVNLVSHGDRAKASILLSGRGAGNSGALVGPNASLLHAIVALHKKKTLAADARALCCAVLRSVSLEPQCRQVLLKVGWWGLPAVV